MKGSLFHQKHTFFGVPSQFLRWMPGALFYPSKGFKHLPARYKCETTLQRIIMHFPYSLLLTPVRLMVSKEPKSPAYMPFDPLRALQARPF